MWRPLQRLNRSKMGSTCIPLVFGRGKKGARKKDVYRYNPFYEVEVLGADVMNRMDVLAPKILFLLFFPPSFQFTKDDLYNSRNLVPSNSRILKVHQLPAN